MTTPGTTIVLKEHAPASNILHGAARPFVTVIVVTVGCYGAEQFANVITNWD